jgi:cobalt-zinc-cadmium efflux system outer membrane protein
MASTKSAFKLFKRPSIVWMLLMTSWFLVARSAPPQVELADEPTLKDYLADAALNNPGLKAAFNHWQAALEKIPQVRALPDPRFTFSYFIQEVETRVGPQRQKVGLMQSFPWFGKLRLQGDSALKMADAARQQYENLKLQLFYRVKESYYEYYYLARAQMVSDEHVQLLKYLEGVMRTRYQVGLALHADLIRIQVELDRLKERWESVRDLLQPIRAKLNAALNRPLGEPIPTPDRIPPLTLRFSREQLVGLLKTNNPHLKAMDHQAAAAQVGVKLAKKNFWPDFSLGLDYIITDETDMSGVPESGKDPIMAMVSIQLPLWHKKNRAAVNEADARYRAAQKQREERQNDLLSRLDMVYYRFREARRQVELYREALLPRARQSMNVSQSAFESGKVDFLNYIDSLRTLLAFELAYERAQADSAQRLAELEMLVGTELSAAPPGNEKGEK